MSRSLLLSALIYGLLLAGVTIASGDLIALAIPLVIYLLAGYLLSPNSVQLTATRHLSSERVAPNANVTVTVTLTNHGSTLDELLLEDHLPRDLTQHIPLNRHLIRLPSGADYTFTYTVHGPRGGYAFKSIRAQTNDSFAMTNFGVEVEAWSQLFVFPPVQHLRQVTIRPRKTRVFAGSIPARVGGTGTEFFGVHEYQPGDSPRRINWRLSAHQTDVLYANEFQQERAADVGIILDGRLRTNEFARGHSLFEYSVQAAAALSDALLAQGNRVGMLVYAAFLRWTLPGYGKIQREKILHSLAYATPGGSDVFADLEHLPTKLFPPGSQVILISALHEDDLNPLIQLRAQGYQVLVVSPNPVQFELSYLPQTSNTQLAARIVTLERNLLLERAQRAGIQILDWNVAEPFDQTVKKKMTRPYFTQHTVRS